MDEKPNEIIERIESQRNRLGNDLDELESRVKRTTDWKAHFENNPMLMMGVALGGGILLGTMIGSQRSGRSTGQQWSSGSSSQGSRLGAVAGMSGPATSLEKQRATDTLDHVKAALIAFALAKGKEFLTEALPGFEHHLADAERKFAGRAESDAAYGGQRQRQSDPSSSQSYPGQQPESWPQEPRYGAPEHQYSSRTNEPAGFPANPARPGVPS